MTLKKFNHQKRLLTQEINIFSEYQMKVKNEYLKEQYGKCEREARDKLKCLQEKRWGGGAIDE